MERTYVCCLFHVVKSRHDDIVVTGNDKGVVVNKAFKEAEKQGWKVKDVQVGYVRPVFNSSKEIH